MSRATSLPTQPLDVAQYLDVQAADDVCVKGRRIGIEHIIYAYNEGYSPEEIANRFAGLELKVIYTLIAWYLHHRTEVDAFIAQLDARSKSARHEWVYQRSPASLRIELLRKERQIINVAD